MTNKREDAGENEVAQRLAEIQQKGYDGSVPDKRPNSDYTFGGMAPLAGQPDMPDEKSSKEKVNG